MLKTELENLEVEAVVLGRSQLGKNKYRNVDAEEIAPALVGVGLKPAPTREAL